MSSVLLDALYCEEEEEQWEDDQEGLLIQGGERKTSYSNSNKKKIGTNPSSLLPLFLSEQDLFWEDEELLSLFTKEKQQQIHFNNNYKTIVLETDSSLSTVRFEAVQWMLKVIAHYGFSTLTAILAINYLNRFLSSLHFQKDKPWMTQLAAVTCLSLAAKVEETQAPLLLDLQVEETKYVFEAKAIQRMELLVLSTLEWKMNPVTPLSFLDHIIRRLGLKTNLHWDFFHRCERLLLSIVADSRSIRFLPSVLATATMLHVIHQVEPCNAMEYQDQLLGVLKISKEKVNECYQLIVELSNTFLHGHKRKYNGIPASPNGVIDAYFSCDSSNDLWAVIGSSVSSSPSPEPLFKKKKRAHERQMRLPSINRVFVDAVGSPH